MNARKRTLLIKSVTVFVVTTVTVLAMINLKDWFNRREAMLAMEELSRKVVEFKKAQGSMPPQSYVDEIRPTLQGYVRLGRLFYRARWIDFDSPPNEILAYSLKRYHSVFISSGYVVLHLDGRVAWMTPEQFKPLLSHHLHPEEANDIGP